MEYKTTTKRERQRETKIQKYREKKARKTSEIQDKGKRE